jgi:glycosyltransferase involved in cell wall biosynthesis
MIAVVIATYTRPDGKTPFYLRRTLESISNQTFKDYHVYVVGDAYENGEELRDIVSEFPKTSCSNLSVSPERERYGTGNIDIWHSGGVTAANTGITTALSYGIEYIAHIAHDDTWEPNHLELINEVIQKKHPLFICTLSTYTGRILPNLPETHEIIPFCPVECGIIASSVCINYTMTNLRPADPLLVAGIHYPQDAYMWIKMREEMLSMDKKGYVITTLTCHHDEEGYAQTN